MSVRDGEAGGRGRCVVFFVVFFCESLWFVWSRTMPEQRCIEMNGIFARRARDTAQGKPGMSSSGQ